MAKKIGVAVAVLVFGLVVVISIRPATYRVERSISAAAAPPLVFALVEDFNRFQEWSPWAGLDPAMKKEIKGRGKGATYDWSGNDDVGEGRMTITASTLDTRIEQKLEFFRPWESTARTGFNLVPDGDGTKVTWWMEGRNNFMGKAMSLVMDMSATIGADYEKGLAKLKPLAEKDAAKAKAAAEAAAKAAAESAAKAAAEAAAKAADPASAGAAADPAAAAAPAPAGDAPAAQ